MAPTSRLRENLAQEPNVAPCAGVLVTASDGMGPAGVLTAARLAKRTVKAKVTRKG